MLTVCIVLKKIERRELITLKFIPHINPRKFLLDVGGKIFTNNHLHISIRSLHLISNRIIPCIRTVVNSLIKVIDRVKILTFIQIDLLIRSIVIRHRLKISSSFSLRFSVNIVFILFQSCLFIWLFCFLLNGCKPALKPGTCKDQPAHNQKKYNQKNRYGSYKIYQPRIDSGTGIATKSAAKTCIMGEQGRHI